MQKFPRRWNIIDKVNFLQRKIILNSIAYYELNTNKLTDREYDELSLQLVELHKQVDLSKTQYGYVMYGFDGTTGFDLYHRLNLSDKKYLMNIALNIFDCNNKSVTKKKKGGLF